MAATEMLVDGLMEQACETQGLRGFVYDQAIGLRNALARHGVTSSPFLYLLGRSHGQTPESIDEVVSLSIAHRTPARVDMRPWAHRDADDTARLLRESYGAGGALFAPSNTHAEWREYVSTLVEQTGCGVLSPELSPCGHRLAAVCKPSRSSPCWGPAPRISRSWPWIRACAGTAWLVRSQRTSSPAPPAPATCACRSSSPARTTRRGVCTEAWDWASVDDS